MKAKAKLLREQYQQKQRDYQDLKEETLKVVRGTSRLNVDLLNNLIEETTVQMAELEGQIRTAEAELREVLSGAEQVRQEYAQLMDWAGLYDNCSFEAKKMIAAQFVKAVRVKRGYEVDIEFNVSFEEFQTLYLEPESEEDRLPVCYLSLPCGEIRAGWLKIRPIFKTIDIFSFIQFLSRQTNYIIKFFLLKVLYLVYLPSWNKY